MHKNHIDLFFFFFQLTNQITSLFKTAETLQALKTVISALDLMFSQIFFAHINALNLRRSGARCLKAIHSGVFTSQDNVELWNHDLLQITMRSCQHPLSLSFKKRKQ